jgi:hypothetical protein
VTRSHRIGGPLGSLGGLGPLAALAALAAALLLGTGCGEERVAPDPLAEEASRLATARPDLFDGFVPVPELRGGGAKLGIAPPGSELLLEPVGRVLATRPAFRAAGGEGQPVEARVTLLRDGGGELWTREAPGGRLDYPPDVPALAEGATYVWRLSLRRGGATVEAERRFAVATVAERSRYAAARNEIQTRVPEPLRGLLAAHWALRHDLLLEAHALAREAATSRGAHAERAKATLRLVERRLGSSGT